MPADDNANEPAEAIEAVESAEVFESKRSLLARILMGMVRFYQSIPKTRGPICRFQPSCSRYALDALEVHGAIYGTWLTIKRLLRCRPFGPWGFDPIPPPRKKS